MEDINKLGILVAIAFVFFMYYDPRICILILGFSITGIGIFAKISHTNIKKNGIKSSGKLIFFQFDEDGDSKPMIEFKTTDGKLIQNKPFLYLSANIGGINLHKNAKNDTVEVLYNPKKPKEFIVTSENNNLTIIFFMLLGLVVSAVGILNILEIINLNL